MSIPRYMVSNDLALADFDVIESLLRTSYWASTRPRDVIEAAFRSPASLPFFVFDLAAPAVAEDAKVRAGGDARAPGRDTPRTVGFGRVVTDRLTIGWLCDVMIHPEHRGTGVGKLLVSSIVRHPDLDKPGVRLILGTSDAHGLYEQFGFFRRELMWRHPMGADKGQGF